MMELVSQSLQEGGALRYLLQIAGAFLLALPVAWERERSTRLMGLRTFPLVAIASCGYVLMAVSVVGANDEASARIIQGLMTGIGFIGGGALLKTGHGVRGTATAASVWTTGAVGAAAAFNRWDIAILLAIANFLTLRYMSVVEEEITGEPHDQNQDEKEEEGFDDRGRN